MHVQYRKTMYKYIVNCDHNSKACRIKTVSIKQSQYYFVNNKFFIVINISVHVFQKVQQKWDKRAF